MHSNISVIPIHSKEDFKNMMIAGKLSANVLQYIQPFVNPGISTNELNTLCHEYILKHHAIPAPLNYKGFPKSVCTSINSVVCHGIPSPTDILKDGDIINIDITVIVNGWHGDTSKTFLVGESFAKNKPSTLKARHLVNVTYKAMLEGIKMAKPGNKLSHIGGAIQTLVEKEGFTIVREYCGHGIGKTFHQEPMVLHYLPTKDEPFEDLILKPGMFFTIEPMVNEGKRDITLSAKDGWTVRTRDGKLSAQFEHTIGITEDGCQIFTIPDGVVDE